MLSDEEVSILNGLYDIFGPAYVGEDKLDLSKIDDYETTINDILGNFERVCYILKIVENNPNVYPENYTDPDYLESTKHKANFIRNTIVLLVQQEKEQLCTNAFEKKLAEIVNTKKDIEKSGTQSSPELRRDALLTIPKTEDESEDEYLKRAVRAVALLRIFPKAENESPDEYHDRAMQAIVAGEFAEKVLQEGRELAQRGLAFSGSGSDAMGAGVSSAVRAGIDAVTGASPNSIVPEARDENKSPPPKP